jgi:sec-independent protein translocase protein TatA
MRLTNREIGGGFALCLGRRFNRKKDIAMPDLGVPELLIIAVIVLLLFGPGKAADIGSSLGKSIREFRKATQEDDGTPTPPPVQLASSADVVAPAADTVAAPAPTASRYCVECGSGIAQSQKFCTGCGKPAAEPATTH